MLNNLAISLFNFNLSSSSSSSQTVTLASPHFSYLLFHSPSSTCDSAISRRWTPRESHESYFSNFPYKSTNIEIEYEMEMDEPCEGDGSWACAATLYTPVPVLPPSICARIYCSMCHFGMLQCLYLYFWSSNFLYLTAFFLVCLFLLLLYVIVLVHHPLKLNNW